MEKQSTIAEQATAITYEYLFGHKQKKITPECASVTDEQTAAEIEKLPEETQQILGAVDRRIGKSVLDDAFVQQIEDCYQRIIKIPAGQRNQQYYDCVLLHRAVTALMMENFELKQDKMGMFMELLKTTQDKTKADLAYGRNSFKRKSDLLGRTKPEDHNHGFRR